MIKSILPNTRKHDITFRISGQIDISANVARKLSLSPGDVIDIAHEDGEWYLYVKLRAGSYVGRHDGKVWATSKGKGTFRAWNRALTNLLLTATGAGEKLRCPCGDMLECNNHTFITIIHRCAL